MRKGVWSASLIWLDWERKKRSALVQANNNNNNKCFHTMNQSARKTSTALEPGARSRRLLLLVTRLEALDKQTNASEFIKTKSKKTRFSLSFATSNSIFGGRFTRHHRQVAARLSTQRQSQSLSDLAPLVWSTFLFFLSFVPSQVESKFFHFNSDHIKKQPKNLFRP